MTAYKKYVEDKAKSVDDFIAKNPSLSQEGVTEVKERVMALKNQVARMETAWESMFDGLEEDVYNALEKMYMDTKTHADKTLDAAWKAISNTTPTTTGGQANVKIDDTLRPKHELLRSFTLEEANIWFDSFEAYVNHNRKVIDKLEVKVQRQLLFNSIEAAMASALQTDETITQDTPIIGDESCLKKLKAYFMEKNPLFLRRHRFQQCQQAPGETVAEWWVRKRAKARECELDQIKAEDVYLLELIRGVRDPKLREEFLKQKEPKLVDLLQIAERWQTANTVSKDMGEESMNARKASTYKNEKAGKWQQEAQDRGRQSGSNEKCGNCGRTPKHTKDECPAKDKTCKKCNKKGHFQVVCRSQTQGRARSQTPGSNARSVRL